MTDVQAIFIGGCLMTISPAVEWRVIGALWAILTWAYKF